jgi:hypothetical protein
MAVGRKVNPLGVLALIGANERPFYSETDTDYGLAFTRDLFLATPLGSRLFAHFSVAAVAGNQSGIRIAPSREFGVWIEECFCENAWVALWDEGPLVGEVALAAGAGTPIILSYEHASSPVPVPADLGLFQGSLVGVIAATIAQGINNSSLISRVGSRFWIPPGGDLFIGGLAVATIFAGSLSLSFAPVD